MKYPGFVIVAIAIILVNKGMGSDDVTMLVGLIIGSGIYILTWIDKTE